MRLLALHFPRFPVQRRVTESPALAHRPLVLHADERGSQRVVFASGAAQKEGVRVGQTVAAACALCPALQKLPYDPAAEAQALHALGERLLLLSPGFQVDGPDGLWLDASAAHLSGGEAPWASKVLKVCGEAGFAARAAVGSERFTTRALARWGDDGVTVVEPGGGGALAGLPLEALEAGWLGEGVVGSFRSLGISSLGEVAALPAGALTARFGALGRQAARLSRGEDDSRFTADALPETLVEEVRLDWPAEQLEPVLFALKSALDRLCLRLQGRQRAAVRLSVSFALDGSSSSVHPERSRGGAPLVMPLRLARPSSQGKKLLELIRHQLQDLTVDRPIGAVEVRVEEDCAEDGRQLLLGDAPEGDAALEVVLSKLQSALGEDALFSAQGLLRHKPEAGWKPVPFRPPDAGQVSDLWGLLETGLPGTVELGKGGKTEPVTREAKVPVGARPVRLFAKPSPLIAELSAVGELTWVQLLGRRRRVQAVWGPERLAGEWWEADGYARDYYRVELEGVGELWVFRDGRDGRLYAQGVFD